VIRVKVTAARLRSLIQAAQPTWYMKAAVETARVRGAARPDFPSLWSKIKQVFIDLQHSKCGFCEKPLEGKIEQDVEHYRPKAKVTCWKVPRAIVMAIAAEGFTIVQPAPRSPEPGYTLLAYHPHNYLMACKNCNTVLKKNYFPIAGTRQSDGTDPRALMASEQPYLLYPIGDIDDDPEGLIQFEGLSPRPAMSHGFDRLRALVTIDIFKLDDWRRRKMLLRGRAHLLRELYLALRAVDTEPDPSTRLKRSVLVQELLSEENPFTNCMRCFHRLYQSHPREAEKVFDDVSRLLKKSSP
jgi:hypothetical protein